MQVRLAALKREEDALQRERETLEAAKLAHIKCAVMPAMHQIWIPHWHTLLCCESINCAKLAHNK